MLNRLAIGSSPKENESVTYLIDNGVKNILALCSEEEIEWNSKISSNFKTKRIVLPDSRANVSLTLNQLNQAYNSLYKFMEHGTTFVHCFASIERSPILCTLYIMVHYKIELEEALDYVCSKHKYANPTNSQLTLIKKFKKELGN